MTRVKTGAVKVHGLVELNTSLRRMPGEFQKELRQTNKAVAETVKDDAASAARSLGSVAAHVAPNLKASAGATAAGVSLGGSRYPMAAGAEFGSDTFKQFQPWRGGGSGAGYFLYPTIRRDAAKIETEYERALARLRRKVGL